MEINSLPSTPATAPPAVVTVPPSHFLMTPLASPMKRAAVSIKGYFEEMGHLTKLDPSDAWLPITESRGGNAAYAAFHTLSSGIGFQALMLPVAFASLGWTWGLICLVLVFLWQFYTLWLLTQLHEDVSGVRYSRYLHLCIVAFGEKLGKILAKFPIMYLSGGSCTALVVVGGGSMKLFYNTVCGSACREYSGPLTAVEWYVVFACMAAVVAQLPNLNSIAGVSLIGAVTALGYCTTTWVLSVAEGPVSGSTDGVAGEETIARRALDVFTGIGIIAFAFRGHNLTLEIQGTMPSTLKHPSHVPMWREGCKDCICSHCTMLLSNCHWRVLGLWRQHHAKWHPLGLTRVPRRGHPPVSARIDDTNGGDQLLELLPTLRHAGLRHTRVGVHEPTKPTMPEAATHRDPTALWRARLLHRGRLPIPPRSRSIARRSRTAGDPRLPVLHVGRTQAAGAAQWLVVASLGPGGRWDGPQLLVGWHRPLGSH